MPHTFIGWEQPVGSLSSWHRWSSVLRAAGGPQGTFSWPLGPTPCTEHMYFSAQIWAAALPMAPVGLSSCGGIRTGRLVRWTLAPISVIGHGATTNAILSLLHYPFYIFFNLSYDSPRLGQVWWCEWQLPSWGSWTHDNHSSWGGVTTCPFILERKQCSTRRDPNGWPGVLVSSGGSIKIPQTAWL